MKTRIKDDSKTLTEVMADRKRVVDVHAALETSLKTQEEELYFQYNCFLYSIFS